VKKKQKPKKQSRFITRKVILNGKPISGAIFIGNLYEDKLYPVRAEFLVGLDRISVKYEQ